VTRAVAALLVALVLGCSSRSEPAKPPVVHNEAPTPAPSPIDAAMPEAPIEFVVTEGSPSPLPGGVTVDVRGVMYAHLANSGNLSGATVILRGGGQTVEVPLQRYHGTNAPEEAWQGALGWELRLEYADAYHKPAQVGLTARRATP
jgi:hypothetical protein